MSLSLVAKEKLRNRIELHYYEDLVSSEYKVETLEATQLLTCNRFDLSFKLMFLKMISHDVKFAQKAYEEHVRALSLGKFKEPENLQKDNITNYIKVFHDIFNDIKNYGFNDNKSIIPLSTNGSIANGAHRVASSIILGTKIPCVNIAVTEHIYDYKFFYERNVPQKLMDAAACEFIENANNVYLAIIWPTAVGKDDDLESIFKSIVYRKEVKLNANGAHNLLSQIYYGEDWIGSVEDNFKGAEGKLIECFKSFNEIRFIAFQSESIEHVRKIKEEIRSIFYLGKHSIHITDTHTETLRVSRVIFNENSIHFLNYAKPNKFTSTHKKIKKYKAFLNENNISCDDAILDSGIILSAYGLREAQDTDFLINNRGDLNVKFDLIDNHEEVLKYYAFNKVDMIYDQQLYFYFNDLKFISFSNLYQMKKNRAETKDQNDLILMEALIESNTFKENYAKLKQIVYYEKIKSRQRILNLLKALGLYVFLKKIYEGLKK